MAVPRHSRILLNNRVILMSMNGQLVNTLELLARTPSADNSPLWRFVIGESRICCRSLPAEQTLGPFGPLDHATLLSAGAMQESMEQLFRGDSCIESIIDADRWAINLTYRGLPDLQGAAAEGLAKRHTNRHPYTKEPIVWPMVPEEWSEGGKVLLIRDPASISALGAAVSTCSAARFSCQELHEWLFSSLRWNEVEAARGDGLDIASLHLPPGGKQFMRFIAPWRRMALLNRFGLYKIMATIDARLVAEAPAMVVIEGKRDPASVWEAGRIMQAAWVALNAAGLAVHPYYVVTDIANRLTAGRLDTRWRVPVEKQLDKLNKLFGLASERQIHMLMRVGTPSKVAKRSTRLPLERLLDLPTL